MATWEHHHRPSPRLLRGLNGQGQAAAVNGVQSRTAANITERYVTGMMHELAVSQPFVPSNYFSANGACQRNPSLFTDTLSTA
jgi:hypothetical protein